MNKNTLCISLYVDECSKGAIGNSKIRNNTPSPPPPIFSTDLYRAGVLSPTYLWEVTQTCMFMRKKCIDPRELNQNMYV